MEERKSGLGDLGVFAIIIGIYLIFAGPLRARAQRWITAFFGSIVSFFVAICVCVSLADWLYWYNEHRHFKIMPAVWGFGVLGLIGYILLMIQACREFKRAIGE